MVRFAIVVLKSALFMAYPKIIGNAAKKGEVRAFQVIYLSSMTIIGDNNSLGH